MPRRLVMLTVGLIAGALVSCIVSAAAVASPSPARAASVAREVLADSDYQTRLVDQEKEAPYTRQVDGREISGHGLSGLASIVMWMIVVFALGLAVLWGVRALLARQRSESGRDGPPSEHAARQAGAASPQDWGRLAAAGDYTEAAHALLLATLARLFAELGISSHPSFTSRELARLFLFPKDGGRHFATNGREEQEPPASLPYDGEQLFEMIARVERAVFGGVPMGRDDWARCLAASRELGG